MTQYLDAARSIAESTVRKNAANVDRTSAFPSSSIDALRDAGLLGLISAKEVGGVGEGPRAAAAVVELLARECGSTAMVTCMHYAGTHVIEKFGPEAIRKDIALGNHLSTLALSEKGSRSHFWAPMSTARREGDDIILDAEKSWCTSAHHATAYVWSSRPADTEGASTLWLVPRNSDGLEIGSGFDGLGLRGNDSTPIAATGVRIPAAYRLGEDGGGLAVMLETILPIFNAMIAGCGIGFMEAATQASCAHAGKTRYEHLNEALADSPVTRAKLAQMRIRTDMVRTLWLDTFSAMEAGREDVMLRVLECKAAAGSSATWVLDLAMQVCGGAAFRRDIGVERRFRDARAGTVMAPTTDQLYDFIGKAICGLPVF